MLAQVALGEEEGDSCKASHSGANPEEAIKVGPMGEDDACQNKTSFKQWLRKPPQQPQQIPWPNFLRLFTELVLKPRITTTACL